MHESIIKSMLRRFFMVIATMAGILFAIVLFFGVMSLAMDKAEETPEIKYSYAPLIEANAQGLREELSSSAPVILKINVEGVIGLDELNRHNIGSMLVESRERSLKDRVKGVFLVINSPGGTVIDADGIYRALKTYKKQSNVPIYAYVDGMCASGGMMVACAADKIYASESSLVGSVGVIVPTAMNFAKVLNTYGVEAKTLFAGHNKDELNPFRPWKENEGQNYQNVIDAFYKQFVDIVTSSRSDLSKEKLVSDYGAKVFSADKAVEYGYIDEANMTLNEALERFAKALDLKDSEYQVVRLEDQNWLQALLRNNRRSPMFSGILNHRLELPLELDPRLNSQFLYLYRP